MEAKRTSDQQEYPVHELKLSYDHILVPFP